MAKPAYYQAEIPSTEVDSDLNWLQFVASQEMQTMLPENLFENQFEDSSFTALLGLRAGAAENLLQRTSIVSETFVADEDISIEADWQKQKDFVGVAKIESKANLGSGLGIEAPAVPCCTTFPSDAGFVERAVKYSSFANGNNSPHMNKFLAVNNNSSHKKKPEEMGNSKSANDLKLQSPKKKRKNAPSSKTINSGKRCKGLESTEKTTEDSEAKVEEQSEKNNDKCVKKSEEEKITLPDKSNYIHVRARRGQATDSHSLAERVRREKISERMKLLQDLVPGCSRITGKALMLDEIINHVQSLQRQVEFLSMKLATVNRRFDLDIDSLFTKEIMTPSMREASNNGISQLMASPYVQYQQPEPTSSMDFIPPDFNMGFHPTRIQPPLQSQSIPGIFALNHMMKREI